MNYIVYNRDSKHAFFRSFLEPFCCRWLPILEGFGTAHVARDDIHVREVRFAVHGKTLELVFLVKWVRYQGARGFGWARWRRHRCSTPAVIRTASPRCSHRAGLSRRDRTVTQNSPEYTGLTGKKGAFQILSET